MTPLADTERSVLFGVAFLLIAVAVIAYRLHSRWERLSPRYSTPLILVGFITAGLLALGPRVPLGFLLYFPAIVISTIHSGRNFGIGAAVLSVLGYALSNLANPAATPLLHNVAFVGTNLLIVSALVGTIIDAERGLRRAAQERRTREQEALYQLADALVNAAELDATLDAAVDIVVRILELDAAAIILREDGRTVVMKSRGKLAGSEGQQVSKGTASISAAAMARVQPAVVSDFAQETGLHPWEAEEEPALRAGLAVPMVRGGKPRGALAGFSLKPRAFSQDDVHLLSLIANQTLTAVERKRAEIALHRTLAELETAVAERTSELTRTNEQLQLELTERKRIEEALQQANEKLEDWVGELEHRSCELTWLSEMTDLLQSCITAKEAYSVIAQSVQKLSPRSSGVLYVMNPSLNLAELAAGWGGLAESGREVFEPSECYALRRGRLHVVEDPQTELLCAHLSQPASSGYMCVPLMAQGEALGVLHMIFAQPPLEAGEPVSDSEKQLALTVADQIGLALANLRLRETLHNQAIHDPLTGLYNRRYMEGWLERELRRAERNQSPLGVIMIDLDHFKKFNDTLGHDAGDALLRELSAFLQSRIRGEDIACRYGGEEFTILLPGTTVEATSERAAQLQSEFKRLHLHQRYQTFGNVTLSMGLAAFPQHGSTAPAVLWAADLALYRAKGAGRDRVEVCQAEDAQKVDQGQLEAMNGWMDGKRLIEIPLHTNGAMHTASNL